MLTLILTLASLKIALRFCSVPKLGLNQGGDETWQDLYLETCELVNRSATPYGVLVNSVEERIRPSAKIYVANVLKSICISPFIDFFFAFEMISQLHLGPCGRLPLLVDYSINKNCTY